MAATLRDTLIQQQQQKRDRQNQYRSEQAVFNYQFPFVEGEKQPGFFISPAKYTDDEQLAEKLKPDYHKQLPMQHDLQVPQFAHRVLKDYQKIETIKNAYRRVRANMITMREDKIKEKEKFMSMMQAIKAEDELKEKLRLQSMKATQTTLEQQIKQKKEQKEQEEKFHKSFVSVGGLPCSSY